MSKVERLLPVISTDAPISAPHVKRLINRGFDASGNRLSGEGIESEGIACATAGIERRDKSMDVRKIFSFVIDANDFFALRCKISKKSGIDKNGQLSGLWKEGE